MKTLITIYLVTNASIMINQAYYDRITKFSEGIKMLIFGLPIELIKLFKNI